MDDNQCIIPTVGNRWCQKINFKVKKKVTSLFFRAQLVYNDKTPIYPNNLLILENLGAR